MVRPTSRAPSVGLRPTALSNKRHRRKKPYRVQLEQVMAKKKKLKLHDIHGSAKPRPGYTFLPVGHADLAERCKEQSRKLGVEVAVVSAGTRKGVTDPQKLTHHVHRVGYHFRTDIFDNACNFLGYREVNGKLVRETGMDIDSRFEQTVARFGPRFDLIDVNNHSAEESTKVKKYIRELFPKIPEEDLNEIYKRAWEQGATTVGNAHNLSLSRQVQLATIARIRHTYTDYDKLLREVSWREARSAVEQTCLSKLIQWRGEQENDADDFEEILRETIVIDDEDDDDEDDEKDDDDDDDDDLDSNVDSDNAATDNGSDTSLEIVQYTVAPKDLRVEAGETLRPQRRTVPSQARAMDRVLPAAVQNRWRDARLRHHATNNQTMPRPLGHPGQISVPLDLRGNAPRTFMSGGVEYVRLPSPEQHEPVQTCVAAPGFGNALPLAPRDSGVSGVYDTRRNRDYNVHARDAAPRNPLPLVARAAAPAPVIDLRTPPKPQYREYREYGDTDPCLDSRVPVPRPVAYRVDGAMPAHTQYRRDVPHTYASRPSDAALAQVVPQSPGYAQHSGEVLQRSRLPSTIEHLDLTKPEDRPIQSREVATSQGPAFHRTFSAAERPRAQFSHTFGQASPVPYGQTLYHQPVAGQPAYPQMRSQQVMVTREMSRPVHGAPAAVQPLPPLGRAPSIGQAVGDFGAPSPQKYFVGSRERPYYVPHR